MQWWTKNLIFYLFRIVQLFLFKNWLLISFEAGTNITRYYNNLETGLVWREKMNLSESSKLPLVTCKNRFSVCPFVSLFSCPFVHSFICPFNICPSVGLSSCLLGHLSNCPPLPACLLSVYRFVICLFVLSVCPTAGKLICLCLFICLFAQFYFYLFVYLFPRV